MSHSAFNAASRAARGRSELCRLTWATCTHIMTGVLDAYEPDGTSGGSGQDNDTFDAAEGDFDDSTIAGGTSGGEPVQPFEAVMQRAAATWILKIREGHRIPLIVMDVIISDLQSLLHVAHSQLLDAVELPLRQAGVSSEVAERIRDELHRANPASIFRGLQTQSQQLLYFRTHFRLVVSSEIVLQVSE